MRISDWSSDVCSSDLPGHDVDVVALDHHMDGLNGLETLALIQHLSDPPPVVFVTGEVEGRVAISALKAGASDYVITEASADFQVLLQRSERGSVGKECVSTCKSRW